MLTFSDAMPGVACHNNGDDETRLAATLILYLGSEPATHIKMTIDLFKGVTAGCVPCECS